MFLEVILVELDVPGSDNLVLRWNLNKVDPSGVIAYIVANECTRCHLLKTTRFCNLFVKAIGNAANFDEVATIRLPLKHYFERSLPSK